MTEQATLTGSRVTLRPMARSDRDGMLRAAADGKLWSMRVTSVPSPETVGAWIDRAIAGREAEAVEAGAKVGRGRGHPHGDGFGHGASVARAARETRRQTAGAGQRPRADSEEPSAKPAVRS
jgi:hypothetical protein